MTGRATLSAVTAPCARRSGSAARRSRADQYEIKADADHRDIYGTRRYAVAKPGTPFYQRMASWPKAFVDAMKDICARHFPAG